MGRFGNALRAIFPMLFSDAPSSSEAQGSIREIQTQVADIASNPNTAGVASGAIKRPSRRVKRVGLSYGGTSSRSTVVFNESEYNLDEIAAALDTEGYFRRAKDKIIEMIWKNGYSITGKDQKAVAYIKRRLNQIAQVTGIPTRLLLEDIAQQLVPYFNCVVVKVRNNNNSGGYPRKSMDGRVLQPVAGYFVQDVTTIKVAKQDNGELIRYKQEIPGISRSPEWKPDDVIHMYMSRKVGLTFGTPMVVPVLDDIRALRRMEENIEVLVFQHAVPLFQYLVGSNDAPADDDDIQNAKATVNEMPPNGMVVTPHTHNITAIGAEGRAIRAEGYLNYFKSRVWAGLGLSGVSFGEGNTANRGTAITLDKNAQDLAKKFQSTIRTFVNEFIIKELLLEGGFQWDASEFDYLVELFIPEIDIDAKIKAENHTLELLQGDGITFDEFRREIGREPYTDEDWRDTYWERIAKKRALIQAIDEPYTNSPSRMNSMTRVPASKSVSNKDQPTNQHGQKLAPDRPKNDMLIGDEITRDDQILLNRLNLREFDRKMMAIYDIIRTDTIDYLKAHYTLEKTALRKLRDNPLSMYFALSHDKLLSDAVPFLQLGFNIGFADAYQATGNLISESVYMDVDEIETFLKKNTQRLIRDVSRRVIRTIAGNQEEQELFLNVHAAFDVMEYRIRFFTRSHIMKAYNIGYVRALKSLGWERVKLQVDCKDHRCLVHPQVLDLTKEPVDYSELPPFHPNCMCYPKVEKGD